MQIIIFAQDPRPQVQNAWQELSRFLDAESDVSYEVVDETAQLQLNNHPAELAVVLGGDGAILRACRQMGSEQLPIIGVNCGRLGFLTDLSLIEFQQYFPAICNREYHVGDHLMFECTLRNQSGKSEVFLGLNEVAILAGASIQMIDIALSIDEEEVTTCSGDGLIVSTPVGSTAHSLSSGGPILKQELQAFVITPVCPHTLTMRPIVDDANCTYSLRVPNAPAGTTLIIDGQIRREITADDVIEVRKADVAFRLARIAGHSFYTTLHRKLRWGGQPEYRTL